MPRALTSPFLIASARRARELGLAGLSWWLGELRAMVPAYITSALGTRAPPLFLKLCPDAVTILEQRGPELARLPLAEPLPLPEPLARRVAAAGAIILMLPQSMVLRRIIDLPLSAERELGAAIAFEIDRQTPFTPDQVHHRFRILTRDLGRRRLSVELAIVPRAALDTARLAVQSLGLMADAIRVEQDELQPPLEFLPHRLGLDLRRWRDEPWRPLAAAALILLLAGTGTIAWYRHDQAATLIAAVAEQRRIGHQAQARRDEIEQEEAAARFLLERGQSPRAIEILDTVTKLLPDDSWVFGLDLTLQEARIEGFAADVPGIIERLQQTPIFETAQLRAPVTRSAAKSRDRFDLALPLKRNAP